MPSLQEIDKSIRVKQNEIANFAREIVYLYRVGKETYERDTQDTIQELDQPLQMKLAQIEQNFESDTKTANETYSNEKESARSELESATRLAESTSQKEVGIIAEEADNYAKATASQREAWGSDFWLSWKPSSSDSTQLGTVMGQYLGAELETSISVPAIVPFIGFQRNIIVKTNTPRDPKLCEVIQAQLLRIITQLPPSRLHFTFVDPVGLGQNIAPFMHLADYDEILVNSRAWSEPHHIEQRLANLTGEIEDIIQGKLLNVYQDIESFNASELVPEPYRLLVIFDYPVNASELTARRLVSIAQNGPRCGVYSLVVVDTNKQLPHGFRIEDLEQKAEIFTWKDGHLIWQRFPNWQIQPEPTPPKQVFNNVLEKIGKAAVELGNVKVPFEEILAPPLEWWKGNSSESIRAALGPSGARKTLHLEFGKGTAHHGLIAGRTGSGKSTLLHALITSLVTTYSPDEVELYLIDFKEGVEFKRYANAALPHAKVVAVESEREFGLSVLQGLDKLIVQRGELFKRFDAKNLSEARAKSGEKIPRVLLLVDEFQVFFAEDDKIASESLSLIDRIVRQGRSFGVHVLFGSQSLAGSASLPRPIMDQMYVRIALQCSEADSRIILADDNPAARLLSRPGEAIYNAANGTVEGNNRFQVAFLDDASQQVILERVKALATAQEISREPIIFEGNAPASIQQKNPLAANMVGPWPSPAKKIPAYLGEPIAIKEPTAAFVRRQSGNNLLLLGQDEAATTGMLGTAILSLAVQQSPKHAQFCVLDFTAVDDEAQSNVFEALREGLPHNFKLGKRRELPLFLGELSEELKLRLEAEQGGAGRPSLYLVIAGLQRARDLRQEDGGFSYDAPATETPGQLLAKILRDGPELGIHTLLSCDTLANLNRTLERRSLNELEMRVVLQMSADDSSSLIDSPAASKLGAYRAYFYSAEEGRMEKFRPYQVPTNAWLQQITQVLGRKQS